MFLDIGVGIIAGILLGNYFGLGLGSLYILVGILISVLPDLDFIYYFLKRGKDKDRKEDYLHRDLIHYPLIYLPAGFLIFYIAGGVAWAWLFFVCSLLHFIHDSIGIGWGIKWLWPFSKNNFAFFYIYSGKKKGGLKKLLFSFDKKELAKIASEHGDKDWVRNIYFKWHPIAIIELLVFAAAAVLFVISINS